MAKKPWTAEDDALLDALGVDEEAKPAAKYTPRQERIIAGFEEIQRFVEEHGRLPQHGEGNDIFERLYAVRLDRIRALPECMELLAVFDTGGILEGGPAVAAPTEDMSDDDLLAALGGESEGESDITRLKHVKSTSERKPPDEVAHRTRCQDFEQFEPIFKQVQRELDAGLRRTPKYEQNADIKAGEMFILAGQKALVVHMGDEFETDYERTNRRLRVVFDNGTESNMLLRSMQRALWKNPNSRRILEPDTAKGTLFSGDAEEGDAQSGRIYVLQSLSDHPFIAENREFVHKIGVTGGEVERRIANAKKDPTFLLSGVKLVDSYTLSNINRARLENLLHRFFAEARIDMQLRDRFGEAVEPREWFLVPLPVIRQAIGLLIDGTILEWKYDPKQARLVKRDKDVSS